MGVGFPSHVSFAIRPERFPRPVVPPVVTRESWSATYSGSVGLYVNADVEAVCGTLHLWRILARCRRYLEYVSQMDLFGGLFIGGIGRVTTPFEGRDGRAFRSQAWLDLAFPGEVASSANCGPSAGRFPVSGFWLGGPWYLRPMDLPATTD